MFAGVVPDRNDIVFRQSEVQRTSMLIVADVEMGKVVVGMIASWSSSRAEAEPLVLYISVAKTKWKKHHHKSHTYNTCIHMPRAVYIGYKCPQRHTRYCT